MKRLIDHIVYCVPNLEEAIKDLGERLGITPSVGGKHLSKGSKNALLNLGNRCYLEILAIDKDNRNIGAPRWMGLDYIDKPTITRWCLKSNELEKDATILKTANPKLGEIGEGMRKLSNNKTLKWKMIMPLASPTINVLPFMTDWSSSVSHPCDQLVEGCNLKSICLFHPKTDQIKPILKDLKSQVLLVQNKDSKISIQIEGAKGIITI